MRQIMTALAAAALVAAATACSPQSEPEPENEGVAAAMPETPDRSDTAADERAVREDAPAAGAEPAGQDPERASGDNG